MYQYGMKRAARLINLTDKTIQVYDKSSGEIVIVQPQSHVLPTKPLKENLEKNIYYIFSKRIANRLKRNGRSLQDIAIIKSYSRGRSNTEITTLVWGEDIKTEICLYENLNHLFY